MSTRSVNLCIACLVASALATTPEAEAGFVVAPNAYENTAGDTDNRFPFFVTGGMRYQQVFDASQFSSFGGPQLINEIDFRNGQFVNEAFTTTIASIKISLSTTSASPDGLSTTFANNIGADATTVYSGALTLSSTNASGPGNTKVFDVAIHFQNAFLYDPSKGNLLLDVMNNSGADASIVGFDYLDAVNDGGDSVSRIYGPEGSSSATTASESDSLGLIARFGFGAAVVPEPSSLTLLAIGGLGVVVAGRRARANRKA